MSENTWHEKDGTLIKYVPPAHFWFIPKVSHRSLHFDSVTYRIWHYLDVVLEANLQFKLGLYRKISFDAIGKTKVMESKCAIRHTTIVIGYMQKKKIQTEFKLIDLNSEVRG